MFIVLQYMMYIPTHEYHYLPIGTFLSYYKGEDEYSSGDSPIQRFNLTGAEAIPDVDVGKKKYAMNIILPSSDETGEIRLLFESVSVLCVCVCHCACGVCV